MKQNGFSLIELIVAIGIISTLLAIATLNFRDWQISRNIESQTKEMQTDLMALRIRALHTKMLHSVTLQPNGYQARSFANALDPGTVLYTKTLNYPIVNNGVATIRFNSTGFTNDEQTIRTADSNTGASLDCIVISNARTNVGKITNGICDHQ